ncbi:hypothetical protein N7481_000815 [Penicillium waksmanii]|uniref:uncharacterized protein n=1 Tax=Penicillium waksmanii TaxID=69791 RepID=UPI0025487B52|nr:uncharacterized protein N7481_000815 [Penicillium waksmanii]KAJ6000406.1 hypothetical protein N7481_000815 [Penicillium waksmanii]
MAGEVRQPIDIPSLERYIDQNVPALKTPLDVKQFGFGQSNPTYQLTTADGKKFVLRKKPPRQAAREYKIIRSLGDTDVPVPDALCLCEDNDVIGTPFYIMSFLDGRHFTDPAMLGWKSAIQTLAKFHRVVPKSIGLEKFGKPSGFYDRQIATFTTISRAQAQVLDVDSKEPVGELPHFEDMVRFFSEKSSQPRDRGTLVHGDYKIDNLIFHHTEPRVIGILDWEMATVGHPLSDFCNVTSPYILRRGGFIDGVVPARADAGSAIA